MADCRPSSRKLQSESLANSDISPTVEFYKLLALALDLCDARGVVKLPEYIPISPMTLVCPKCGARVEQACTMLRGEVELLHVERIGAAAQKDVAAKKARRK